MVALRQAVVWTVSLILLAPLAAAQEVVLVQRYVGPGPAACLRDAGDVGVLACVFTDLPPEAAASLSVRDDLLGARAFTWEVLSATTGLTCASGTAQGDATFTLPPGCTVVGYRLSGREATTGTATLRVA